jgi:hypothetical protein
MQDVLFRSDVNGVAGVVSTLGANDDIGSLGENVDDFTLTFVAPLGAH